MGNTIEGAKYIFSLFHDIAGSHNATEDVIDWDTIKERIVRDDEYHGVSVSFLLEVRFVKAAFDFINTIYNTFGREAAVMVQIFESDPHNPNFHKIYEGSLGLETWHVSEQDEAGVPYMVGKTTIDALGFDQQFLTSEDIEVDLQKLQSIHGEALASFPKELTPVEMHSKQIIKAYEAHAHDLKKYAGLPSNGSNNKLQNFMFGFDDIKTNELGVFSYPTGFLSESLYFELFEATDAGVYDFNININAIISVDRTKTERYYMGYWVFFYKGELANPFRDAFKLAEGRTDSNGGKHIEQKLAIQHTATLELAAGEKVFLSGRMLIGDDNSERTKTPYIQMLEGSSITINARTFAPETVATGVMIHEAFSRICSSYTGKSNAFYSELYGRTDSYPVQYPEDGEASNRMLLNGFAIRGFPITGTTVEPTRPELGGIFGDFIEAAVYALMLDHYKKVKGQEKSIYASFKELFKNCDAIDCIGAGIEVVNGERVVRVEKRKHFYSDEVILTLPYTKNLKRYPANNLTYNEAEFGYSEWKVEETNGLDEFNASIHYTLPLKKAKGKYSAMCNYIAGGYRIEKVRRDRFVFSNTKDNNDDDKNFFLCVSRDMDKFKSERIDKAITVNNVLDPGSAYNLRIAPARMRNNHLAELKGCLLHHEDKSLYFNKGIANYKLESQLINEEHLIITEGDIPIVSLPEATHTAEYYELESIVTQQQARIVRRNPYGLIEFYDAAGGVHKGHILSYEHQKESKTAIFKLRKFKAND